jgi:hypothetical protein
MSGDLLEPAVRPIGEACVHKIRLRELGEALRIESILEVLQGEGKIQDIYVWKKSTVKWIREIRRHARGHAPLGAASRGRGLATARIAKMGRKRF